MKSITLVTKGKNTCIALMEQLNSLLGDKININSYYIDGNIKYGICDDLIVISSKDIYDSAKKYINKNCPIIIAQRSINYTEVDKILNIPSGTNVLLVNDLKSTTYETISLLNALGINHIRYFPYYPGINEYPNLKLAITPGELDLVPNFIKNVININVRNIDFVTIIEIFKLLKFPKEKANFLSARYIKNIIDLIKKARYMAELNNQIKNQLNTVINTVHDGIIALNKDNSISAFNPIAENIFRLSQEKVLGKNIHDKFIKENIFSKLKIANEKENEQEQFAKINDRYIVINKQEVHQKNDSIADTVYTLKDVTEIQRLEQEARKKLIVQGNYAHYTFDEIMGESKEIKKIKEQAEKLAKSNSPILIQGESGTGKELFAQAIHNASKRNKGPFIAVNFAALTESLLESELFGYDEGAFTGAKKGGMSGLFEQAHRGTIFLDEIGDAPMQFQIKLLRVLQEKQVRRIGGSNLIPIDIRVISATNKNLKELVHEGKFRADLYYRLNVLPLKIPPLRDRTEDIMSLAYIFYMDFLKNNPFMAKSFTSPQNYFCLVKEYFLLYKWPGNIRELMNVVEYLLNICGSHPPDPASLPEEFRTNIPHEGLVQDKNNIKLLVLKEIKKSNDLDEHIGRRSISKKLGISEEKIRKIIDTFKDNGYIEVRKGSKGLKILEKGQQILYHSSLH